MRTRKERSRMMRRRNGQGLPFTRRKGMKRERKRERERVRIWMRKALMSPTSCWMR